MPTPITLRELLKDPIYKQWFLKVPTLGQSSAITPNWRIFAREEPEGRWASVEFENYRQGLVWVRDNLRDYHDIVINSKREAFKPPVVVHKKTPIFDKKTKKKIGVKKHRRYHIPFPAQDADVIEDQHKHVWCPYCRRPTLFLWYRKHPAMKGVTLSPHERRCNVCGVRLVFIKRYV